MSNKARDGNGISTKKFQWVFAWDQWTDDLETWIVASGIQVLPRLFRWWPLVDLDLFTARSTMRNAMI